MTIDSTGGKNPITALSTYIVFFIALSVFLGAAGYLGAWLLQEENQRKIHQLNMQLLSEQVDHILKERLRVVKALADNRLATGVVSGREGSNSERVRLFLHTAKEVSHSDVIYIIDKGGIAVSSTDIDDLSIIGYNYSFRPYFQNAVAGHTAIFPAFGVTSRVRGLHLSTPIYGSDQHVPIGVMALKINISEVEDLLKIRKEKIALVSPDHVIFSSNQTDWLFHSIKPLTSQTRERLQKTRQFGEQEINPLELELDLETLSIDGEIYYNTRTPLPISGWDIISLQKKDNQSPLPLFHKQILGVSLGVTGCLATLVFFLLIAMQHQKKARSMLRCAEENYAGIFRNAAMGIFRSTLDGRFIDANPSLASLLGFSSPRHLMTSVTNIGDEIYVSADDRRQLSRLLEANAEVKGFETRFHRRDGSIIWVTLTCRIAVDQTNSQTYLEGFCMDISEKKSAEKALLRERDIFSRVMVTSPVGIVMVNTNREITFANPRAEEILTLVRTGHESPIYETPKWRITSIDGTKIEKEILPAGKVIATGRPVRDERLGIKWPDGRLVMVSINMGPVFNEDGSVTGIVSVFEDITEKIRNRKEAALRQEQLLLADRMIAMGILTSGVAHEINNPNTFIHSNAQLLFDAWKEAGIILNEYYEENGDFLIGGLPFTLFRERLPTLCSRILDGSRRITRIVKELRDYARNESPGVAEPIKVNQVIQSARILLANMINKSTQYFVLNLQDEIPCIRGSFQRLEQVIVNIIQNACQALLDDHCGVLVSSCLDPAGDLVVIVCSDEGMGITGDNLKRVMDPFFTTKRDSGGTGLGLSVCATIVREMDGTMDIRSEQGKGTRVTLKFPVIKGEI